MSEENRMTAYLASNPRKIGVLFTLMVLLSQAGTAAATGVTTLPGP